MREQSEHKSVIFMLLENGGIRPLPQRDYVSLLRGELRLAEHSNEAIRVADWYTDMHAGQPARVVNETYSVLQLDARGAIDWGRCRVGRGRNHALYEALKKSEYDDPDDDPAVRKLRGETCDEVAWLPNSEERDRLQRLLHGGRENAAKGPRRAG
jgi:hypothetical protein